MKNDADAALRADARRVFLMIVFLALLGALVSLVGCGMTRERVETVSSKPVDEDGDGKADYIEYTDKVTRELSAEIKAGIETTTRAVAGEIIGKLPVPEAVKEVATDTTTAVVSWATAALTALLAGGAFMRKRREWIEAPPPVK